MAKVRETGMRRVYVLPTELVERITAHQEKRGYASEVETVRRLIETALNVSEDASSIIERLARTLKDVKDLHEAAKIVLVGHPLVTDIHFTRDYLQVWLRDYGAYQIYDDGKVLKGFGKDLTEWTEINMKTLLQDD